MNKILNKTIILFFIISLTSCKYSISYKPIFMEKDYDFQIKEVFSSGDKDINRTIENKLRFIKNNSGEKEKNYIVNIYSTKYRKIVSKDSKGDPVKFELKILVEYKIVNKNNILANNQIEKKNIYNNDSDQFKLEQTEEIILQNLSESIGDNIISTILNLDDN